LLKYIFFFALFYNYIYENYLNTILLLATVIHKKGK